MSTLSQYEKLKLMEVNILKNVGVTGVSVDKSKGDAYGGSGKVRIYVENIRTASRVPETLFGQQVEVIVTGKLVTLPLTLLQTNRTSYMRPAPGGVSIGHYCYDSETRIMTEDGLLHFWELTEANRVCTLNPDTKEIEFHKPLEILKFPYSGTMIRFAQKHYDIMVTPNHYLYVKSRKWKDWRLTQTVDVMQYSLDSMEFLCKANWKGISSKEMNIPIVKSNSNRIRQKPTMPTDLYVKLLGWYLAEGCTGKPGKVILDCGEQYISEVVDLVRELGFTAWTESPKGKTTRVAFSSKQLNSYLRQFGNCYIKYIPNDVKSLSSNYLQLLLETLCKGDGHIEGRDGICKGLPRWYSTTSKRLAEDIAEIAFKIGITPKISITKRSGYGNCNGRDCYIVNFSYKETSPRLSNAIVQKENYNGYVYCVTVPNHIILVERNGKMVFSGNSITAGTLATRVFDRLGRKLILSNNHIFANSNNAKIGDPILQPGPYDGGTLAQQIGVLERFVPITESGNIVDCALARPLKESDVADEVLDIGVVNDLEEATIGMTVGKSGRTSGYSEATVTDITATVKIAGYGTMEAIFEDQIFTSLLGKPGDSGSLVINSATKKAVGLLFAGSDTVTCCNKFSHVMEYVHTGLGGGVGVVPGVSPMMFLLPLGLGLVTTYPFIK